MREEVLLSVGVVWSFVFAPAVGCGGKIVESEVAGSGGAAATGGVGGTGGTNTGGVGGPHTGGTGGGGGTVVGGMGGGGMGGGGMGGVGGATCSDYLPGITDCRICLGVACCSEVTTCFQDPDGFCPTAVGCYEKCPPGDPYGCAQACDDGNFSVPFNDLFNCGLTKCPGPCQDTSAPQCPLHSKTAACDDCVQTQCAAECNACAANPECAGLAACLQPCGSPQCQKGCIDQYPGGVDDYLALITPPGCVATNCGVPCGY